MNADVDAHTTCTTEKGGTDIERTWLIEPSVAVTAQGGLDRLFHAFMDRGGSAKVATTLLRQPGCQVARAGAAVHRFTRGRQAKTLFCRLVGFHLGLGFSFGHDKIKPQNLNWKPRWRCRVDKIEGGKQNAKSSEFRIRSSRMPTSASEMDTLARRECNEQASWTIGHPPRFAAVLRASAFPKYL